MINEDLPWTTAVHEIPLDTPVLAILAGSDEVPFMIERPSDNAGEVYATHGRNMLGDIFPLNSVSKWLCVLK